MTRILIVDDDSVIRDLLVDVLETEGYEVSQAGDGQTAVETARAWMPHLILMDLMMPVLDGSSAIRILKSDEETRLIPIIVMSAVMHLHRHSAELPANGFIDKPFDIDALLDDVARQVGTDDGIEVKETL